MSKLLNRISTALFALLVAGGLAFGGSQALSSPAVEECGDDFNEVGTCPPLNPDTCEDECIGEGFPHGGDCVRGCCRCLV